MAHYNSKFPKRHHAWSNSREIRLLDMGVLCREYQRKLATYLVAGRNTWAQNISRVLSQGLGVFQHSGILANLFSAWASYMHMDMYIEIQSHICVCVFSARAQELPSGLWEEDLQDPFQTCQHEGPPGSDW